MDAHSSPQAGANRHRSSWTTSPSHSAAASATSVIPERKTNDDLKNISAPAGGGDAEPEDAIDSHSSMRMFTAARLSTGESTNRATNTKPKTDDSTVKLESSDGGKDGGTAGSVAAGPAVEAESSVPGIVAKEDTSNIFTENIQTTGAYSAREESLKREEEAGSLKFVCLSNDSIDQHIVWLIELKNIFSRQLPNMPKEYIVRLVMDRRHKSMMVIRCNKAVGGITYRPYVSQKFGEIAFCAITSDEQVKGYCTRLMNHLKQHARDVDGLTHFLTYADNNAVGYFIKQGFTKEINLEKDRWQGYIKDYDGGVLMECKIHPKLPFTDLSNTVRHQRQAIDEKIRELSNRHIVYPGIDFQKNEAGIPKEIIKVEDIPGLREAGWTPDQWGHSRFRFVNASTDRALNQKHLTAFMRLLIKAMHDHVDAWSFKEPVNARDVPDYYDVIKNPMDLKTMSRRVESEQYYVTFEMFVADVKRMFANARTFNSPETIYYRCATRLESHFQSKVQASVRSGSKIQR